jgi:hypothetical protein
MSIKELEKEKAKLIKERQEILNCEMYGRDAELASGAISDIEFKIVCLDDQIDFQKRLIPFKIGLYVFVIVSLAIIGYAIAQY